MHGRIKRLFRRLSAVIAIAMMAAGLANVVGTPAAHAAVTAPAGFTESLVASGLARPYTMTFAPDGRLFVTEQGGTLRVIKNGALLSQPFLTVTVDQNGDRGLISSAFDPDFANNHYVYIYYTTPTPVPPSGWTAARRSGLRRRTRPAPPEA